MIYNPWELDPLGDMEKVKRIGERGRGKGKGEEKVSDKNFGKGAGD